MMYTIHHITLECVGMGSNGGCTYIIYPQCSWHTIYSTCMSNAHAYKHVHVHILGHAHVLLRLLEIALLSKCSLVLMHAIFQVWNCDTYRPHVAQRGGKIPGQQILSKGPCTPPGLLDHLSPSSCVSSP